MNENNRLATISLVVSHSNLGFIIALFLLAFSALFACGFFLFKKIAYFDDSFIYLHIAANVVEMGTARYFPIADSSMLLSSSPLKLFTLVPAFYVLEIFHVPLRNIEAARFVFFSSGLVAYLLFVPFWVNRLRIYFLLGSVFFLLSISLDTIFLMEGGLLFVSLFTLIKLLHEDTKNHFALGISVLLIGLARPEIGGVVVIVIALIYSSQPRTLVGIMLGLIVGFTLYAAIMIFFGVYPIPSTIWSKQMTGKLKLFTDKNLIDNLSLNISNIMGLHWPWMGWILIGVTAACSLVLSRGAIPILAAIFLLLVLANFMPGNFVWYSENFLIVLLSIIAAIMIESYRRGMVIISISLGFVVLLILTTTLLANFGNNKPYPWNENSRGYLAYKEVGQSSVGDGKYIIKLYSNEPVRIRMCEIGIVSFFSGPNAWIYDVCGLVQIGNLKGASQSWLRYLFPSSFVETGDDQIARFDDAEMIHVIDVWALRSEEEAAGAIGKCKFVDERLCVNEYK